METVSGTDVFLPAIIALLLLSLIALKFTGAPGFYLGCMEILVGTNRQYYHQFITKCQCAYSWQ